MPYTTTIEVRFRDLDTMGHVNNALYATYLEQARADFFLDVLGESLPDVDTVIAHLSVDFRTPIDVHDAVEIDLTVTDMGESSLHMDYEVRAEGEVAATAETVQVVWDRDAGGSKGIPDAWRRDIEAFRADDG